MQNPPRKPPQDILPALQWCLLAGESLVCFSQCKISEFFNEQIKWEWPREPVCGELQRYDCVLCWSSIFLSFHCFLGFSHLIWTFFTVRHSLDFQGRLLYLQTKRAPMFNERIQAFPSESWLLFRPCAAHGLVITLPGLMSTFSFSRWFMNFP